MVLTASNKTTFLVRTPVQAKAFLFVPDQLDIGIWNAPWRQAVFRAIENEDSAIHRKGCNNIWILRLIAGLVDFAWMVDLLYDIELDDHRLPLAPVAANFTAFLVVFLRVGFDSLGDLNLGDLEIVGFALGCVGSKQ